MSSHLTVFIFGLMGVSLGLSLKSDKLDSEELFMLVFCLLPGLVFFDISDAILNNNPINVTVYLIVLYIVVSIVLSKVFDGRFSGKLKKLVAYYIGSLLMAFVSAFTMNVFPG